MHYVSRGLMKRFESGAVLAKDIGLDSKYHDSVTTKKDPFGQKV